MLYETSIELTPATDIDYDTRKAVTVTYAFEDDIDKCEEAVLKLKDNTEGKVLHLAKEMGFTSGIHYLEQTITVDGAFYDSDEGEVALDIENGKMEVLT